MSTKLEESQNKLDAIEKDIIANKKQRITLRTEAHKLRDSYIAEEKIREKLLRESLTEGDK